MMIAIRQITTFNTGKFPNPYLVSLCTRLCWHCKWQKKLGWAQCVKPWQRDRNCPGMRESAGVGIAQGQGAALHNQRARRCTGLRHTHKIKGFAEIERCAVTARGVARGTPAALHDQCHAMRALQTSKPFMFAAGDFQHFLCYTREEGQPIPCKII